MAHRQRAFFVIALLAIFSAASLVLAVSVGSLTVSFSDVFHALFGPFFSGQETSNTAIEVVRNLRLPRALAAFACGGLLAMAGALMQVLLRNPLADPYVLGVSGGASLGALGAMLFGLPLIFLHGGAFIGALIAVLLVFGLARGDGSWTRARLLLTGVIVAAGCGAVITLILTIAPEQQLRGMLFWLMGDLSHAGSPSWALIVLVVGLLATLPFSRDLNLLARGDLTAQSLGVSVSRLRLVVYGLSALFTAVAVTTTGNVGFVGLIVPHWVRLVLGNDQRVLLPAVVLAGGTLLTLADTLARTIVAPLQLPVGVLTALIGVPVFLYFLARDSRNHQGGAA